MSAVNASAPNSKDGPPGRETKPAEKPLREPSMEEILASIRQIISGDQQLPLAARSAVLPPLVRPASHVAPPIRAKLQQPVHATARASAATELPSPAASENFEDIAVAVRGEPAVLAEPPPLPRVMAEPTADAAPADAELPPQTFEREQPRPSLTFATPLAAFAPAPSRVAKAEEPVRTDEALLSATVGAQVSSSFSTLATTVLMQKMPPIEELARDILRPMLKSWLDDNLPVLVEKLVRAEIERVARGGR